MTDQAVPLIRGRPAHPTGAAKIGRRVLLDSGTATADDALKAGLTWVGRHQEIGGSGSGVFRSLDNPSRQFRMNGDDLVGDSAHVHFDVIGSDGRSIIETGHLRIIQ